MHVLDFFFSSRRRHTRWPRDWSSDVCSSDLSCSRVCLIYGGVALSTIKQTLLQLDAAGQLDRVRMLLLTNRSEERRVGKGCRVRRPPLDERKGPARTRGEGGALGQAGSDRKP